MKNVEIRLWDENTKEMTYINDLYYLEEQGIHEIKDGEAEGHFAIENVMFKTPFKDYKGNKVFDGDILKRRVHCMMYGTDLDEWVDDIAVVEWREDYGGFYVGERPLFAEINTTRDYYTSCTCTKYEVIGNIYEDLEILEVYKRLC